MAMNNSNYGYPSSGFSSPYSSTPGGIRTQRPRFGYSGPTLYPRPRSSASKPNPDSYSDSMINNYGSSNSEIDLSYNSENGNSYNDSYLSTGSNYYSANDSYYNQSNEESSYVHKEPAAMRDSSMMYNDSSVMYNDRSRGDNQNSGILPKPTSQFGPTKYQYNNSSYGGTLSMADYKGSLQKTWSFGFGDQNNKNPLNRKFGKAKRRMATTTTKQSVWKCELCALDFTSQIPYDMHLGGARHAKKLKAKEALNAVQSQGTNSTIQGPDGEKAFFCELCNVKANSLLQLQTHLDGNKHKNKLHPKDPKDQAEGSKEKESTSVNGKTNGSLTRSLPSEFGEPQPTKLTKFACEVCGISVNSEIQLQQHMSSKKHQNKVEGKPVVKGKKAKLENQTASEADIEMVAEQASNETSENETSKMIVGVKTLASSFVQGGTLK